MRRLPLWRYDQGAMVNKGQWVRQASLQGNKARASSLSGPNDFHTARFCLPAQRQANCPMLQGSNHLCQPLLRPPLHPHDNKHVQRWNNQGKESFQTICCQPFCHHWTLPRQQWPLCQHWVNQPLLPTATMTHLLWCQCSLPKQFGWKSHQRYHWGRKKTTLAWHDKMAASGRSNIMAIYTTLCNAYF